ncbi:hypothetical protein M422DRAFT_191895, partial [Sphaerobolus stellatus SS14]
SVDAWVVDIPDPRKTSEMIQWLKDQSFENDALKHVKHIRRWTDPEINGITALLLVPADQPAPALPDGLTPYITPIPRFPARTLDQVKAKTLIWPVFYEAYNHKEIKEEAQRWTPQTVKWFRDGVNIIRKEAKRVRALGELPIVSYVPPSPDAHPGGSRSFIAHDTRVSSQHPLRHSAFNLIRLIGDSTSDSSKPAENGQNYLLTGKTLFTTHEPCIACSMAILHSRVREIVYLYPMPQTGGCGSVTCVPALQGVNHRYTIWRWRGVPAGAGGVDVKVDA